MTSRIFERTQWAEVDVVDMPFLDKVQAPKREAVGTYLRALKATALRALLVTLLSALTGIFALGGLIVFLQTGASFLHPYLAIFLAFGSTALFAVALVSILSMRKQLESVIGRALRSSYEPY
jgi:hypothetical protein